MTTDAQRPAPQGVPTQAAPEGRPTLLLFDVMDTVVVDPFFADDLGSLFGLELKALLVEMTPDVWPVFERGEIDRETYYARFTRGGIERLGVTGPALEAWMAERYRWVPGMEGLLQELQAAGVQQVSLSNYPAWWQLIESRLGLSRYLDWRFVSCKTGVRKPDPRAYLGPAEALGVAPERCVFIDDRESNCAAARAVGMHGLRFTDSATLRAQLQSLGVFG